MTATRGRRWWQALAFIAGAALAGYVVTCAIFPAPILPKSILVPAFRGMPAESALAHLTRLGLRGKLADTVVDPLTPPGTIAWQSPVSETALPEGAVVRLGVSNGSPPVSLPDLVDLDLATARSIVEAAGLNTAKVDTVPGELPAGTVVTSAPAAGTTMRVGDAVILTVSAGPGPVRVPDVTGASLAAARERLQAAGLRVGTIDHRPDAPAGSVVAQQPQAGESVPRESGVNLTIGGNER